MKLEEEAQKQLKVLSIKFKDDSKTKEFERTSNEFEELVKMGVAKKRGYKLLSPSDSNRRAIFFNRVR